MTPIQEMYKTLKFVSDPKDLTEKQVQVLESVLQEEINVRRERRIEYLLNRSGLKPIKRLEDFDWKFNPKIMREEIMGVAQALCNHEVINCMLIGPAGVGKTHLAKGLGYKAVLECIPVLFITCHDLINKIKQSRNKAATIEYYVKAQVLCIDEIGYVFPDVKEANDIFQIISKRSEVASTIITTNLIPSQWGKIFEAATATAILDRLSFNGKFISWEGRSYRTKK